MALTYYSDQNRGPAYEGLFAIGSNSAYSTAVTGAGTTVGTTLQIKNDPAFRFSIECGTLVVASTTNVYVLYVDQSDTSTFPATQTVISQHDLDTELPQTYAEVIERSYQRVRIVATGSTSIHKAKVWFHG